MKLGRFEVVKSIARRVVAWLASSQASYFVVETLFLISGRRRMRSDNDLSHVQRLLVVRLDEIGDVVLTTPFLRELRRNLPNAWITLIVKPEAYNLVEHCPYVNEVLTYDWSGYRLFEGHWRALRWAWKHLWSRRFELAILPRWDTDWYHAALLVYFSGAPWRAGYSEHISAEKQRLNGGFDCLLTHLLVDGALKHEVEHNLDMLRFLGGTVENDRLELWLTAEDSAIAARTWESHRVRGHDLVVGLGPSSGNTLLKQWPVSNFVEFASWLRTYYQARVLIVGGPGEETLGEIIESATGASVVNMVGKTSLRQTAALLKRCQLYVGNDAGPMHMASAVSVPAIALFGSSCPHRFGPWQERGNVLWSAVPCSACFQDNHRDRCPSCPFDRLHCMLAITLDQVKAVTSRVLEESGNWSSSERL